MLTGIGLRNFKAFGDEMQEAPLSKITLIYGPNSGGKSSIIQALLLLKQSLKPRYSRDRRLESKGEFVDLGSPHSMFHKHDTERELGISVKYKNLELGDDGAENSIGLLFLFEKKDLVLFPEDCAVLVIKTYEIISDENDTPLLKAELGPESVCTFRVLGIDGEQVPHHFSEDFLPTLWLSELSQERSFAINTLSEYQSDSFKNVALEWTDASELQQAFRQNRIGTASVWRRILEQSLTRATRARENILGLVHHQIMHQKQEEEQKQTLWQALEEARELAEAKVDEKKIRMPQLTSAQMLRLTPENIPVDYEHHLRLINYLGPLRSAPQRIYTRSSAGDSTTGVQGEYSANVLARDPDGVETEVNHWFSQFDVLYDIHARKLDEASFAGEFIVIELMPLDKEGVIVDEDFAVTLADVGYGINQILPVIIEGIASQEGSILCVEQPEIHLHPRLQANIADLMIDTIADEPGKRKQWIVETHSELLITRIQRRIREGKIKSEDVSVLYVDPDDEHTEGSAIIPLRVDENGDFIDHWPHGFFDEAFNELTAELEDVHSHPANSVEGNSVTASVQSEESPDD